MSTLTGCKEENKTDAKELIAHSWQINSVAADPSYGMNQNFLSSILTFERNGRLLIASGKHAEFGSFSISDVGKLLTIADRKGSKAIHKIMEL